MTIPSLGRRPLARRNAPVGGCGPGAGPIRVYGRRVGCALTLALLGLAWAADAAAVQGRVDRRPGPDSQEAPALLVLLVVDQLPAHLLEKYEGLFTGGFKRLMSQGRVYTDATHDHAITETSPGHASLSTGTYPSRHGMVSNVWYSKSESGEWEPVQNVRDGQVLMLGEEPLEGSSPAALMRTGLADWLVEENSDAKIASVSGKDRGAVLLAGKSGGLVYWFEPGWARFATSTYYTGDDPDWIEAFNEEMAPRLQADTVWESIVPEPARALSRPDTAAFERDGTDTYFPHVFGGDGSGVSQAHWWATTPFVDREVLALARTAVRELDMGGDDATDLLAVSLSQTDLVGHDFGPHSREQLDNLLRLDRELGAFLAFLDDELEGRYVLALSSDHGSMDVPESPREEGGYGRRLTREDAQRLNELASDLIRTYGRYGSDSLSIALAKGIVELDWIARAWPYRVLASPPAADTFAVLASRSLYPGRATGLLGRYDVHLQLAPYVLLWVWARGTDHGSPYRYDRHVPLVFFGEGVTTGRIDTSASTVSLAPTLAALVGVAFPDDLDGPPLSLR